MQSVLDAQGRIIGWFTWEPDRPMSHGAGRLMPLLALTGAVPGRLCRHCAVAGAQRALRDLAREREQACARRHEDKLTGLPNHAKMIELLDLALAERGRR